MKDPDIEVLRIRLERLEQRLSRHENMCIDQTGDAMRALFQELREELEKEMK